jgi:hypothetical protein
MTLLKGGEEIVPGISVKTFPGHTAHMQAVIVDGSVGKGTNGKRTTSVVPSPSDAGKGTASVVPIGTGFEGARLSAAPSESETGKDTASAVPSADSKENGASAPAIACYISDLIPTTAHIDITWGMAFDLYPLQTIESKKQYYANAIPDKWLTVFTHDAKTPWAYVEKDGLGKMGVRGI